MYWKHNFNTIEFIMKKCPTKDGRQLCAVKNPTSTMKTFRQKSVHARWNWKSHVKILQAGTFSCPHQCTLHIGVLPLAIWKIWKEDLLNFWEHAKTPKVFQEIFWCWWLEPKDLGQLVPLEWAVSKRTLLSNVYFHFIGPL